MKPETPKPAAPANAHADGAALDALVIEGAGLDVPLNPGGAPVPEAAPAVPTDKLLVMVLDPAFQILAPNWKIRQGEVEQLATAYAAVIDKYFPDSLNAYGPEISAVLVTAMILAPRAGTPPKVEKEPEKPAADAPA